MSDSQQQTGSEDIEPQAQAPQAQAPPQFVPVPDFLRGEVLSEEVTAMAPDVAPSVNGVMARFGAVLNDMKVAKEQGSSIETPAQTAELTNVLQDTLNLIPMMLQSMQKLPFKSPVDRENVESEMHAGMSAMLGSDLASAMFGPAAGVAPPPVDVARFMDLVNANPTLHRDVMQSEPLDVGGNDQLMSSLMAQFSPFLANIQNGLPPPPPPPPAPEVD